MLQVMAQSEAVMLIGVETHIGEERVGGTPA